MYVLDIIGFSSIFEVVEGLVFYSRNFIFPEYLTRYHSFYLENV
jgi:hypothetical protein